jgi:hypothetical protein
MGETTAQAFSDIVTGIGRGSALILDNLGIVVDAEAANEAYAESIGKTASQLSEAEKKQALFNAVVEDSTQIVQDNKAAGDDAASNYERMDAAIQNAKDALGQLFSPAVAAVAQMLADAATKVTEKVEEIGQTDMGTLTQEAYDAQASIAGLQEQLVTVTATLADMKASGEEGSLAYQNLAQASADLHAKINAANAAVAQFGETASKTSGDIYDMWIAEQSANVVAQQTAIAADQAAAGLDRLAQQALLTGSAMINMGADARAAMEQFNLALGLVRDIDSQIASAATQAGVLFAGKQGGDAGLAKQQAVTDELSQQRQIWSDMGYTDKEINEVLLPGMVSSIQSANSALFSSAKHTEKLSDEAKAAKQAFEDIESAVSGVLQGALDPGVGVDPQKILEGMGFPRADAINENARRLADIAANGLKDQDWLGAFQSEVPDIWKMIRLAQNPQEEAARLLQDFQDGLLTSPIDKAKAKEIVRRQITGDQNMAALATEIATELATEMGIPMQQALAAAQGTLGGGEGMGTEAANSFADGASAALDESNGGGGFVTKFTEQMKASYGLLTTAGKDAGKLWGAGFLEVVGDNVPPALISLLTDLVTPAIMSKMAQSGTLTAATP